ncbi:MAG TPA: tetratricopeptide repeat protein [Candidatus Polarisedimenticolia bacterium]|nr:tetratricopeptide repeat protein [Candidatus Polarisedimenticolia bacterium]
MNPKIATALLRLSACFLLAAIGCGCVGQPALAQSDADSRPEKIGWVPRVILERPVPARQGIGNLHERVTTSSPQAQAFYDQGLDYLYGYDWIEAARSFNQALRLDPNLAIAYLRLSEVYAQLQDNSAARIACNKAQSLSGKVSERERAQIQIRADHLDYIEDPDSEQKYVAWRRAISDALTANLTDWGLWVLLGSAIGDGEGIESVADYETALAFSPHNSAAHHILAHTFEHLGQTQQALAQAYAYVRLAPSIPHAHHMLGHELRRLGRTVEALAEFRKADELENSYYHTENIPGRYDWHHSHNLILLAMCYEALGQMKAAEPLLHEAFSLPAYTDTAEYYRREWPDFLLDRGRPEESLKAAQELIESTSPAGRLAGHEAAGRALIALHRSDEARKELESAEQEMERLPAHLSSELPSGILSGEILLHDQKQSEADALFKKVEADLRAMPGADTWNLALFQLEFIAEVARQSGDWNLAEFTARQMTEHDSSFAGGYYALGLAAEHSGDTASARRQFQMAEKLWGGADPDLPEFIHLREKLRGMRHGF